jgi:methyltransferase family protein
MIVPAPVFYDNLAEWWPLFSPPEHYDEEGADILGRLAPHAASGATLLELGCGGGSLASHLKSHFTLTLTDRSAPIVGDMRTLRLERRFDVVLVHDAILYATTPDDVRATLATAAEHCRAAGTVIVLPDFVRETFAPGTDHGGEDAPDGRGLRYLEWCWDPDPNDDTYTVDYAFLMREASGDVRVAHDRHFEGLFPRARWLEWFEANGLSATSSIDQWGRDVFIARPMKGE